MSIEPNPRPVRRFDRTIGGEGEDLDVDIYWVDAGIIDELEAGHRGSERRPE